MIKILHSADWHLDAPMQGFSPEQRALLQKNLLNIPGKLAAICKAEKCDLVLLAGDLFDGPYTKESFYAVKNALEEMAVPVFITPGNHDFCSVSSPYLTELWPDNVHIFTRPVVENVALPQFSCRIYGAGYTSMECQSLLQDFSLTGAEKYHIGVLHADPAATESTYSPLTRQQIAASGLSYLALGHIHKGGELYAGSTLCRWPGCPMGKGYDEDGEKGVLIAEIGDDVTCRFLPLDTPRFYDWYVDAEDAPAAVLDRLLPPLGNDNFYRITLTGPSEKPDLAALYRDFSRFPNLLLRDNTQPPLDIWGSAGEDSLEGMYFKILQDQLAGAEETQRRRILLAARISRQILNGQEVEL